MQQSTSKHIVIVGPAHPLRGGIATFNERLAAELQSHGHKVTIYTFSYQYPDFLFPGKTQYSTELPPKGIDIKVRINSINPFNWISIGREIKKLNPDLLILRFWIPFMAPCLGTIGRIARSNKKIRITGLVDNIIPHEKRPGDEALTRYFINACHDFMTLSKQVTEEIKLFSDKPCRYSPHPVYDHYGKLVSHEVAAQQLKLDVNQHYLLFFGLVRKYKGLDLLLEAFGKAELTRKKFKLIIAGEFYDDVASYEEIIAKYGLKDQVIIHNSFIADEDVKYYFSIADLVTQTYRTATQSGISQLAIHFEKPMLVTNVGGLGEIIIHKKTGFVCAPEIDAISSTLENFTTNARDIDFSEGIREEKKKYGWEEFERVLLSNLNINL